MSHGARRTRATPDPDLRDDARDGSVSVAAATRAWQAIATAGVFAAFVVAAASIVVFSGRGFDISDEGYYLLISENPTDVQAAVTFAHFYTAALYEAARGDIQVMRLLGMLVLLATAWLLATGVRAVLAQEFPAYAMQVPRVRELAFVGLGALLYYTWPPFTPSYNLISSAAVYAAAGFMFLSLSHLDDRRPSAWRPRVWALSAGFFIGLTALAKFPTAVALAAFASAIVGLWRPASVGDRARILAAITAGGVAAISLHIAVFRLPAPAWRVFQEGVELASTLGAGHGLALLERYAEDLVRTISTLMRFSWPAFAIVAISTAWVWLGPRRGRSGATLVAASALVALAFVALRSARAGWLLGGQQSVGWLFTFYAAWVTMLAVIAASGRAILPKADVTIAWPRRTLLVAGALAALPIIGAFGTANLIAGNAILSMAPTFSLILILSTAAFQGRAESAGAGCLIAVSVFAASQVVSAEIVSPLRLKTGILGQTELTPIGARGASLRLDPETASFMRELRRVAAVAGLQTGDDVIGLVRVPGLVFAIGARSPGIPWYTSGYEGARTYNEHGLSLALRERLREAFVLETSDGQDAMPDLALFGLDFPGRYSLCGELVWPVTGERVRLWKPGAQACGRGSK